MECWKKSLNKSSNILQNMEANIMWLSDDEM